MAQRNKHMATAPKRPAKLTNEEAARKITDIIFEHLRQYPEEEQNRRIDAFCDRVDRLTAERAKRPAQKGTRAKSR